MALFDFFKKNDKSKPGNTSSKKHSSESDNFCMIAENIYYVSGSGVILDGRVKSGVIRKNDKIWVNFKPHTVKGIAINKQSVSSAQAGDEVGLLIDSDNKYLFKSYSVVKLRKETDLLPPDYSASRCEFEELQGSCNQAINEKPDSPTTKELIINLGKKLLSLDKIYIAYDEDFNNNYPYITGDGRIEVLTNPILANSLANHYNTCHFGHVSIREISSNQISEIIESLYSIGINAMRIDNGSMPIDVSLSDIIDSKQTNLLEIINRDTKGLFLRELQYGYRANKIDPSLKKSDRERSLLESMLTMRYNAYRNFGNGLCYVLATTPYQAGITFYTEKALTKAKNLLADYNLPESALIADGDSSYAVYSHSVNLRVAKMNPDQTVQDSMVCAFTGRKEAETIRKSFLQYGTDDSVIVITYDELYTHGLQCAGILIDLPTIGYNLPKKELNLVLTQRNLNGNINAKFDN